MKYDFFTPEREYRKIEKERVLGMLRTYGFEHTETRNLVIECLKDVLYQAYQEDELELSKKIFEKMVLL